MARRLDALSAPELAEEALERALGVNESVSAGLADFRDDLDRYVRHHERELMWERERRIALQKALLGERRANFRFEDEDVLRALRAQYRDEPVTATEIATTLEGREPSHPSRIRVGLALSRLASAGLVSGHRCRPNDPSSPKHWIPALEVDDAR